MGEDSKIQWTNHSWSPWRGCTKVSAGCAHCYAETWSKRNPGLLGQWGKGAPRVKNKNWAMPLRWNRKSIKANAPIPIEAREPSPFLRCRVFPSLCDWLDEEVPIAWLAEFLRLIHDTPGIDWQLLTKRPENWDVRTLAVCHLWKDDPASVEHHRWLMFWRRGLDVPDNVWMGVSVENQEMAELRVPLLLEIPAALRWLSMEPLLGQVELHVKWLEDECDQCGKSMPRHVDGCFNSAGDDDCDGGRRRRPKVDWVVVGGESGPEARVCNIDWIRDVVWRGTGSGFPVFVKQLGANPIAREAELWESAGRPESWTPGKNYVRMKIGDPKGGNILEFPEGLRIREIPASIRLPF